MMEMDLEKLKKVQIELAKRVELRPFESEVRFVAGLDVSYSRKLNKMVAAAVVLSYPSMRVVEYSWSVRDVEFPYVPTFLSFRELPAIEEAFTKLKHKIDLVLVDGQGIAHPRGLGIAAHFGVEMMVPTIGCAKSHLFGKWTMPTPKRGEWTPIIENGQVIGGVVRTRDNVKPIFVSPGNLIDVENAVKWALKLSIGYRLPEPIRLADKISRRIVNEGI